MSLVVGRKILQITLDSILVSSSLNRNVAYLNQLMIYLLAPRSQLFQHNYVVVELYSLLSTLLSTLFGTLLFGNLLFTFFDSFFSR